MSPAVHSPSASKAPSDVSQSAPDTVVIYHGDHCRDGFGAAYVAWKALGDRATYHPVFYQAQPDRSTWPDWTGKHVVVLDYSLPVEWVDAVRQEAKSLIQLDHHATACDRYTEAGKHGPDTHFEHAHSGAMLAWRHFFPEQPPPEFIRDIEDSDLWLFKRDTTLPFARAVLAYPLEFQAWADFETPEGYTRAIQEGHWLEQQWDAWLEEWGSGAQDGYLLGHRVQVTPAHNVFRSGVGNWLNQHDGCWGLIWRAQDDGRVLCSLRSSQKLGQGPCRMAARHFGGGGHDYASGFEWPDLATLMHETGTYWKVPAEGLAHPLELMREEADAEQVGEGLLRDLERRMVAKQAASGEDPALRLDGRTRAAGALPGADRPDERRHAGAVLLRQRDQVVAAALEEAQVIALPGSTPEQSQTRASLWTLPSLAGPVARALFAQGHAEVDLYHSTPEGLVARRYVPGPMAPVIAPPVPRLRVRR